MSYGHSTLYFDSPVEAEKYLASCRETGNYAAENYQDRVSAENCILKARGWAPAPLPPIDSSKTRAAARPTRRAKSAQR